MRMPARAIVLVLLLVLPLNLGAQYQDLQLWSSVAFRTDLTTKLRVTIEEEARFFENISRLDKLNSDLVIDYRLFDNIRIRMLYRLILNGNKDGSFELNHRFSPAIGYQIRKGTWNIELFAKYQKTYEAFNRSADWYLPENHIRLEGEVSRLFNRNRTEPFAGLEFWYYMPQGQVPFVEQWRLTLGVKHKLGPDHRVRLYYRLQQETGVENPLLAHIIGVGYLFTWHR